MPLARRSLLQVAAAVLAPAARGAAETLPPVRPIIRGPRHRWFGYYDELQFDPTSRRVLGMEVGFEHRSPRPDDAIGVGMIDLARGDRWTELGRTRAWNWQQGCMLQWLPGSPSEVVWNDRADAGFVSHVLDVRTRKRRTLPGPIYCPSPDARFALACDFARLNDTRPGYGYAGLPDPNREVLAPTDAGIWRVEMATGKRELLISFAQAAAFQPPAEGWGGAKHWFNHLLCAPDGKRFIFLHRWRKPGQKDFSTRMFTAGARGGELFVLDPHGKNLPGNAWILNDTYPDRDRLQHPYLFHVATGRRVPLGHFRSPPEYTGEWRCDLHPRSSPDGTKVVIDSPHGGSGRQMYLIDVAGII